MTNSKLKFPTQVGMSYGFITVTTCNCSKPPLNCPPARGELYWVTDHHYRRAIVRGWTVGTHQETVVETRKHPTSLAVDVAAGRLYWHFGHSVETVKLDGSERSVLKSVCAKTFSSQAGQITVCILIFKTVFRL